MTAARSAVAIAGALVAACGGNPPPAPHEVARVDGEAIAWSEFEAYVDRNAAGPRAAGDEAVLAALFDQFLEERLLLELALDRGLVEEGDPPRRALEMLLRDAVGEEPDPRAEAGFYADHPERFERPERVRLRQLLLERNDQAVRVAAELRAGRPFEEVAAEAGVDAWMTAGELLTRDDVPPAYVESIFGLAPGEVSQPVAADYGFHVFQVLERLAPERIPFEQALPSIRESLRRERSDAARERLVLEARDRYDLRVFERNLPFEVITRRD